MNSYSQTDYSGKKIIEAQSGFTLIELLIVIAIISVLAAIALVQFRIYKQNSYNAVAQTDLRNGITAEEAAFVDNGFYMSCTDAIDCEGALPGFLATKDKSGTPVINPFEFTDAGNSFTSQAKHHLGSIAYTYDSTQGSIDS